MRAGIVVNAAREDGRWLEAIVSDRSAQQTHVWRSKISNLSHLSDNPFISLKLIFLRSTTNIK
jgi:hypothetical protein